MPMAITRRESGWWITGVPPYYTEGQMHTSCGPYGTKAEAEEDERGLRRFYKANPEAAEGPYDSLLTHMRQGGGTDQMELF
jgi:hypothetical protein